MKQINLTTRPPTKSHNHWERMLKRFCASLSECRIIDTHISECRILMTSCRAAEAANLSCGELRMMLALHLQQCSFSPAHPTQLDCVEEYLDAVQRGNTKLMVAEENAVRAVMRLPFAYTMHPEDTKELDRTIAAIVNRAEETISIADKLTAEYTTAGMICDIVDAIENSARAGKKHAKEVEEICEKANKAARSGAKAGGRDFMREWVSNPILQETGKTRKSGGGAKAKWDKNGKQCEALLDLAQERSFANPSAAADNVIRAGCPKSINPFAYTKKMTAKEKNIVRTKFVKRFKSWCRINNNPYPFDATE